MCNSVIDRPPSAPVAARPEKFSTENMHHGHLQETDMVVGYVDALNAGRIKDGDLVMLATNGAGFSWGASLVQH